MTEVEFWGELTKIPKNQQAIAVALSLPEGSSAREKVFNELTLDDLKTDDGLNKLLEFIRKYCKDEGIAGIYTEYAKFDDIWKGRMDSMQKYIDEFDRLQKRMKKINVQYPDSVLALKLLHRSGLSEADKKIVLTGVDYSKDALYEQMINSLKKFFGQEIGQLPSNCNSQDIVVKSEPVMLVDGEHSMPRPNWISHVVGNEETSNESENIYYGSNRFGGSGRRGRQNNSYFRGNFVRNQRPGYSAAAAAGSGWTNTGRPNSDRMQASGSKNTNPLDSYGKPKLCRICGSKFHFAVRCPDNEKVFKTNTDTGSGSESRDEF